MSWTLEQFSAACQRALTDDPGPGGRKKVCEIVHDVLKDEAFLARHVGDDVPERKILYEDPQLGFCILAHVYQDAKESNPHDHGPSWAIYGQARGETVMSDWAIVQAARPDKPGKVRLVTSYTLKPGMAHVYNEGDLHSPRREGPGPVPPADARDHRRARRHAVLLRRRQPHRAEVHAAGQALDDPRYHEHTVGHRLRRQEHRNRRAGRWALQPSDEPRGQSARRPLRVGRLRQLPRPPLLADRRAEAVVGSAGPGPGRVLPATRDRRRRRWPRLRVRP